MTEAYGEKEESFGVFLKERRTKNAVTIEQLAEGLCSASELARIEAGTRTAGKALQDRLLCRLGISPDIYEHFLFEEDYRRWKKRQQLLYKVVWQDAEEVGRLLQEYQEQYECGARADVDRRLERQFCLSMEAQFLRSRTDIPRTGQGGGQKKVGNLFREALELTVDPGLFSHAAMQGTQEAGRQGARRGLDAMLYSVQELDLLLEWIHYEKPQDWERCYRAIIRLAEDTRFDTLSRAKIYPKAVYYWHRDALGRKTLGLGEKLDAVSLCRDTVQCLREAGRLYYLWELLGLLMGFARDVAAAQRAVGAVQQAGTLEGQVQEWQEWAVALETVYKEFGIPVETNDSCWLYVEKEVYCLNEVLRTRREMLGISRKQLGKNGILCSEKTLRRLEEGGTKAQKGIVRGLMEELNLSAEYCRTELVTSDPEVPEMMNELRTCMRNRDSGRADRLMEQLKGRVFLEIPSNRQVLMRLQYEI